MSGKGSQGGKGMKRFDIDGLGEKLLRKFAGNSSRRSFLTKLGACLLYTSPSPRD